MTRSCVPCVYDSPSPIGWHMKIKQLYHWLTVNVLSSDKLALSYKAIFLGKECSDEAYLRLLSSLVTTEDQKYENADYSHR